jgi:hypothetical protein
MADGVRDRGIKRKTAPVHRDMGQVWGEMGPETVCLGEGFKTLLDIPDSARQICWRVNPGESSEPS